MSFDIVGGRPGGSGPYSCRLEHITPLPDLRSQDERSTPSSAGKLLVGASFPGGHAALLLLRFPLGT
jgi:hypothetical protein